MYMYAIYFMNKGNGIKDGFVKSFSDSEIIFTQSKKDAVSYDTEEECRQAISNLRKKDEYSLYQFRVFRYEKCK